MRLRVGCVSYSLESREIDNINLKNDSSQNEGNSFEIDAQRILLYPLPTDLQCMYWPVANASTTLPHPSSLSNIKNFRRVKGSLRMEQS